MSATAVVWRWCRPRTRPRPPTPGRGCSITVYSARAWRWLIGLQLPGFRLALQNGTWQRHPADQALSGDRINGFVQEWQQATALAVDPMTRKPALGRITLEIREREQVRRLVLEIVGYQPEFVLRRRDEGLEYHFPEDVGRRLMKLGGE